MAAGRRLEMQLLDRLALVTVALDRQSRCVRLGLAQVAQRVHHIDQRSQQVIGRQPGSVTSYKEGLRRLEQPADPVL